MPSFNMNMKLQDLDYCSMILEVKNRNLKALKQQLLDHYNVKLSSSKTNKYKLAQGLFKMFSATTEEVEKQRILDEIQFFSYWCYESHRPVKIYRALLLLTFPLIRELVKILPSFDGNPFTPDIIAERVVETAFESDVTKRDSIYKALKVMLDVGCVKKIRTGVYKTEIVPVLDAPELEACLLAASVLGEGDIDKADIYLAGLSFQITHEFADYYCGINYLSFVPQDIWKQFQDSKANFTLQYKLGEWTVSSEPYLYLEWNKPLGFFNTNWYYSVQEVIDAKMRIKKRIEECGKCSLAPDVKF